MLHRRCHTDTSLIKFLCWNEREIENELIAEKHFNLIFVLSLIAEKEALILRRTKDLSLAERKVEIHSIKWKRRNCSSRTAVD